MASKPVRPTEQDDENPLDPRTIAADEVLGGRQWRRSKIGYITGVGTIRDAAGSMIGSGRDAFGRVSTMFKGAFGKDTSGRKVDASVVGSSERFGAAMAVNGKTDKDIANSIAVTYKQSMLYLALMAVIAIVGFGSFFVFGTVIPQFPLADIVFRVAPIILLGALLLRSAYTNWMFRHRKLLSLSEFFSAPDKMPSSKAPVRRASPPARTGGGGIVKALVLALALSMPASALLDAAPVHAQEAGDFKNTAQEVFGDPNDKDMFMHVLGFMLPNVGPIPAPLGEHGYFNATKTAFMVFSGTLLFIGSAIAGWQILSGLVASAKEGTVLGKAYHEVWAPARMVIGFGMLAPIAGGLCAAQIVVIYMISWGGNLANVVWRPYIDTVTQVTGENSTGADAAQNTLYGANLAASNKMLEYVFNKELCYGYLSKYLETVGAQDAGFWDARAYYIEKNPQWRELVGIAGGIDRTFANDHKYDYNYGQVCGSITTYVIPEPGASEKDPEKQVRAEISQAQFDTIKMFQEQIRPVAQKIASGYVTPDMEPTWADFFREGENANRGQVNSMLQQLRLTYMTKMQEAIQSAYNGTEPGANNSQFEEVRKGAVDNGWAASGVFYMTISRIQNVIYAAASQGASFTTPINGGVNNTPEVFKLLVGSNSSPGILEKFENWWNRTIQEVAPDLSAAALVPTQNASDFDLLNTLIGGTGALNLFKWNEDVNPLNPMQHMIDFGNSMMTAGTLTYGAAVLLESGANSLKDSIVGEAGKLAGITSGVATGLGYILTLARMVALMLIAAGAVHAYVLPMIPYIMTAFFVGGMVILTVEAMVAAPIWAFFHIRMDGQEFVSDVQKPGYMIAFNLILRPALMIFGLILSYLVFGGMAWFIEKTFFPTADSMSSSNAAGPIGMVVMIVMVTYIHYQMAIRAFSLITQVPDRVTRWFGQGGERLGEEDDTHKTSGLLVAQTTSRVEGMARMGGVAGAGRGGNLRGGGGNKPLPKGPTPPAAGDQPKTDPVG